MTLELILVACAVMSQCDMCITIHVENAAAQGASREDILQAALMAVAMGGSPKLMYMKPKLCDSLCDSKSFFFFRLNCIVSFRQACLTSPIRMEYSRAIINPLARRMAHEWKWYRCRSCDR